MQPDERDAGKLWEMRAAAADAMEIAEGLTLERLRADKTSRYAISKAIEIIGEEAGGVSTAFRNAHPELPWPAIVGMRHRLVHRLQTNQLGARVGAVEDRSPGPGSAA